MKRNQCAFAEPNRLLPNNTKVVANIKTTSNDLIYFRSYPYSMSATAFMNRGIESLLSDGIRRPSCSPYNSLIHVVNKKGLDENGKPKLQMVIDFRKLKDKTVSHKYPIPDTKVILGNLENSKYFSTLDLKPGLHRFLLKESDRQKTAFSVNNGKYKFCRLPFCLKNAPNIFQRPIDDILRPYIGKFCLLI